MSKRRYANFFSALPAYLGGKRRLCPWIFGILATILPTHEWEDVTFIDGFLGGGAVSMYAKAQGFREIYTNDWSDRSQLIAQALLQNQHVRLSKADIGLLTQPREKEASPGFVETHFCPSVFSSRHAQALDTLRANLTTIQCPTKQAMAYVLLWHLIHQYVVISSSVGSSNRPYAEALDGIRDWQTLNPKRFLDGGFPNLLRPVWAPVEKLRCQINQGVFAGSDVTASQGDVFDFLARVSGDVLYVDPPYADSVSYETSNRVLDQVLTGQLEKKNPTSLFTQTTSALDALFEASRHIPIWMLSYSNKTLSVEDLIQVVKRHAGSRCVKGWGRRYQHLPHVCQSKQTQEVLIIAYSE